nr:PEGA domain-containing protein [Myxococcota bacterium]
RREEIDRRADVWGLGAVLFELLAGKRLVSGATEVDLILSITQGQLGSLREARPDLDPVLVEIVQRALSPREDRYATARELGIALQRWLAVRGTPTGMVEVAAFMEGLFPSESGRGAPPTVRTKHARAEKAERARDEAAAATSFDVQVDLDSAVLSTGVDSTEVRRTRRGWAIGAAASLVVIASGIGWAAWPREAAEVRLGAASESAISAVNATGSSSETATDTESETVTESEAVAVTETESEPVAVAESETAAESEGSVASETATAPDSATAMSASRPSVARGDERARPSREREVTEGELHVATPGGWADVHVDGRRVGRTPLSLTLPAGTARVELRPFGFAPPSGDSSLRRSVRIGARPTRLSVRLDP